MKKNIKNNTRIIRIFSGLLFFFLWTIAQAGIPLWTLVPTPGSNPTQTVPENETATVTYLVQNQSPKPKNLKIIPMHGITQTTPCQLAPNGEPGSSCILNLAISGRALPVRGIQGGPALCQIDPNGEPDPNQCYQPGESGRLNITRGPVVDATITINPSSLMFTETFTGDVTVTNSPGSLVTANNIVATIPIGSNITVQSTTCGASLAIGASCTITFTAPATEGPTDVEISGSNTNTVILPVTVVAIPVANISINPTSLTFAQNSTGFTTVTNDAGSPAAALNVAATIPPGSNISVQSTTCGPILAIGASCTITFTSGSLEGPTAIPIEGTNTSTLNVDVTVTLQPVISITGPIQQSRIVRVSALPDLSLQITNSAGSLVNANGVTVTAMANCAALIVDASACTSIAPGATCNLVLSSNSAYAPCTITVSGNNTANSPQALIAFFYLGGLAYEGTNGTGRIVIDAAQGFTSRWTNTLAVVAGANDPDDGLQNTNDIVIAASCTASPANCAAQRCRNIDPAWYMPAINQLALIRSTLCPTGVTPCTFGTFTTVPSSYHHSSTQQGGNSQGVFFNDGTVGVTPKTFVRAVRCIRDF